MCGGEKERDRDKERGREEGGGWVLGEEFIRVHIMSVCKMHNQYTPFHFALVPVQKEKQGIIVNMPYIPIHAQ